jgi:DNA-binding NarL/FixJ family response regulator
MRVIVAEDVMITRSGIVSLLKDAGVEVVAEAADASGLVGLVAAHRPDAVVLDIRMPPTHTIEGLVAAGEIRDAFPETAVLLLSQHVEPRYAAQLLHGHVDRVGYLLKQRVFHPATLVDALNRLIDGEIVLDPTIVTRLMARKRIHDPLADLTAREREVLALVAEGLSNRGVADRLHVSERTVETHMNQVFGKLGLEETPVIHRRVLAVLTMLRARP